MEESLENTVEQFKIYLEKQGRSAKTLTSYACSVSMFISLCGELTVENLKRYREYLLKKYRKYKNLRYEPLPRLFTGERPASCFTDTPLRRSSRLAGTNPLKSG